MSDARYVVAIDFDVADIQSKISGLSSRVSPDLFGNATKNFKTEIGSMGSAIGDIGARLSDAFTGAVEKVAEIGMTLGKLGAVAAVGAVTYGVAGLNSQLEKTQIALADILTSNGVTSNLTEGMSEASGLMARIRKDAAALPGETSDLAAIFKLAAIPGLRAGMGTDRVEKLSANAMAFGMGTVGLDGGTTSRELQMLLTGRAGAHNTLGANLGLIGADAHRFNKQSGAEQFAEVEKLLAKHAGSIDLYANSFEGLFSTLKDNAKLLLSTATSPLFEHVKKTLGDINGWFDNNKSTVLTWANVIGSHIVDAFEWGKAKIEEWWPALEKFAENAYDRLVSIWETVQPYVERFGAAVKSALADPATMDRIETVLKLYAGLKVGGMIAPFASGGMSMGMNAARMFGGMMGGGAAGAEGASASMFGLAQALPIVALSGIAAAGAFHTLADSSNAFHDTAMSNIASMKDSFELLTSKNGDLVASFTKVADVLGVVTLDLGTLAGVLLTLPDRIERVVRRIVPDNWDGSLDNDESGQHPHFNAKRMDDYAPRAFGTGANGAASNASAIAERDKPKLPPGIGTMNVTNYVAMTISGNQEPSRIARVVTQHLAGMSRFPTSSRYAPANNLSGRRT